MIELVELELTPVGGEALLLRWLVPKGRELREMSEAFRHAGYIVQTPRRLTFTPQGLAVLLTTVRILLGDGKLTLDGFEDEMLSKFVEP